MDFLDYLKHETTKAQTLNGGATYSTSLNANVDLFGLGGSMRKSSIEDKMELFRKAYEENRQLALVNLVYLRDIRNGGLGERSMFHAGVEFLAKQNDTKALHVLMDHVHEFGRWDDLFVIMKCNKRLFDYGLNIIQTQLLKDMDDMRYDKPVSLLSKWLPNINVADQARRAFARKVATGLGFRGPSGFKAYRKMLVQLRDHLNLVEVRLAAKDYDKIHFDSLPSLAGFKYRRAFGRNIGDRYSQFIDSVLDGKTTMNADLLMPDQIIRAYAPSGDFINREEDPIVEAAWESLKNTIPDGDNNTIVVADTSASMWGTPFTVAEGLAIYTAERLQGVFKNHFITFSSSPQLIKLPENASLWTKMSVYIRNSIVENTNIAKVFKLLLDTAVNNNLPVNQMPSRIVIISDMEFDRQDGTDKTHFEAAKTMFHEAGYELPTLVFWNVNARPGSIPTRYNDEGAILVSGFSTNILENVLTNNFQNPLAFMLATLENPAFNFITEAF